MALRFPEAPRGVVSTEFLERELPSVPHYQEMHHLVAVAKGGKGPGQLSYPRGVAIDSANNQIYVVEAGLRNRISIFSETGEFLKSFSDKLMRDPWGIAVHGGQVYMTDVRKNSLLHFEVSADIRLVAMVGGWGSGNGQFISPRQLTVSPHGEVFVADCSNHRIQVLDTNLRYKRHISHHSMSLPCDVKLTPDLVFVLTFKSPCIHVLTLAGEKIRSLITRGGIGMQVTDPCFFCLDANENVIFSDNGGNKIKIFSKSGTLLHTLGTEGTGLVEFKYPFGIALTKNLKLVVVSSNINHGLQIIS